MDPTEEAILASLGGLGGHGTAGRVKHVWGHVRYRTELTWMIVCAMIAWHVYLRGTTARTLVAATASIAFLFAWALASAFRRARACNARRTEPGYTYDNSVHKEAELAQREFMKAPTPANTTRLYAAILAQEAEWKRTTADLAATGQP